MSLWSPQQHEWLEAMGLQVLQQASTTPVPRVRQDGSESLPVAAASSPRDAPNARLQRAILHAVRACPDGVEWLAAQHVDIEALRNDAAAKRALWPRLRAMRVAVR